MRFCPLKSSFPPPTDVFVTCPTRMRSRSSIARISCDNYAPVMFCDAISTAGLTRTESLGNHVTNNKFIRRTLTFITMHSSDPYHNNLDMFHMHNPPHCTSRYHAWSIPHSYQTYMDYIPDGLRDPHSTEQLLQQ